MSDDTADEIRAAQAARREARLGASANSADAGLALEPAGEKASKKSRFDKYDTSIDAGGSREMDVDDDESASKEPRLLDSCTPVLFLLRTFVIC